jgi:biotin operon repressor
MSSSKFIILAQLQQHPSTSAQLQKKTKLSASSIRARISDLRKLGYEIEKNSGKYTLNEKQSKIETWLKSTNQYNKTININTISSDLKIPVSEVQSEIGKLFKRYHILQISKEDIKISLPSI